LASKKLLIDYNTNTVTLYHELDALILHFGNNVNNNMGKIEPMEDTNKVFANVEIESTARSFKVTLATDYMVKVGREITVRLNCALSPHEFTKYYFIENDKYLRPRGLICSDIFVRDDKWYIKINNMSFKEVFI